MVLIFIINCCSVDAHGPRGVQVSVVANNTSEIYGSCCKTLNRIPGGKAMLYDPLKEESVDWDFTCSKAMSDYGTQVDEMDISGQPVKLKMEITHGLLEGWLFEPLEGVVLGVGAANEIHTLHKTSFNCDNPGLVFTLLLNGMFDMHFEHGERYSLDKNMFIWGDWSGLRGSFAMSPQENYSHVSISMKEDAFSRNFGKVSGGKILAQLRQNLSESGQKGASIFGTASPELITAAHHLQDAPRETCSDILKLKSIAIEFVTKMILDVLGCRAEPAGAFSHQDIEAIRLLKRRLENDVISRENILEMCAGIGMSRTKANMVFKYQYNTTMGKYQNTCRMIYAYKLLSRRKMNVSECAYELGYTNIGHFISAFKKQYKTTPGRVYSTGMAPGDQHVQC